MWKNNWLLANAPISLKDTQQLGFEHAKKSILVYLSNPAMKS